MKRMHARLTARDMHKRQHVLTCHMLMQVAGSDWKLAQEGQSAEVADQQPQFSTWEDVVNKKKSRSSAGPSNSAADQAQDPQLPGLRQGRVLDDAFYRSVKL